MSARLAVASPTIEARYWSHVDRRGPDECWPWTASLKREGHGNFWVGYDALGRAVMDRAHRVGWQLAHGGSPGALHVRHKCDNPACQNPAHMELGTHLDNMRDMCERKRYKVVLGSKHGKSKLVESDIRNMRELYASGATQVSMAEMFGISQSNVSDIVRGKIWRHVEDVA